MKPTWNKLDPQERRVVVFYLVMLLVVLLLGAFHRAPPPDPWPMTALDEAWEEAAWAGR